MLGIATVVFRECLEIALVLGLVMAATRGLSGRWKLVLTGAAIGLAGAVVIAIFTDAISEMMDGMGQEVFNAAIMFVAVAFLSWTVIWMKRHARQMGQQIKALGAQVISGESSCFVLIGVVAFAFFREGAEIVLFSYGMLLSGKITVATLMTSALLGAMGGVVVGLLLYFGLIRAAQRHLFTVTSWMLILLTAGMAAQGASFLVAADVLPPLKDHVWDVSWLISGHSLLGQLLGVLIGFTPKPSGMEVLFYLLVAGGVGMAYYRVGNRPKTTPVQVPHPAGGVC